MFDVVTIGGATVDLFVQTPASRIISIKEAKFQQDFLAFEYGKKIYLDDVVYSMGGGGNNTAVAFARLGLKAAFIGCVGQDEEGRKILMGLKSEGVRTDFVSRVEGQNTGLSLILNSFDGDRTVFSYRGANDQLTSAMIKWSHLEGISWLYIPSLSGHAQDILPDLIDFARKHGIHLACNPGSQQLALGLEGLTPLLGACDILILNKEEGEQLTGLRAPHRVVDPEVYGLDSLRAEPWISDVSEILRAIHGHGAKMAVITDGLKGAHVFDGIDFYWMPVYPFVPLDTLGAGDAFAATFVAGRIGGKSIPDCLRTAAANAGSVVRKFGAQPGLANQAQIQEIVGKYQSIVPMVQQGGNSSESLSRSLTWG